MENKARQKCKQNKKKHEYKTCLEKSTEHRCNEWKLMVINFFNKEKTNKGNNSKRKES